MHLPITSVSGFNSGMKFRLFILSALLSIASCAPTNDRSSSIDTIEESSKNEFSTVVDEDSIEDSPWGSESSLFWSESLEDSFSSISTEYNEENLPVLRHDAIWNPSGGLDDLRGEAFLNSLATRILSTGSKTCSYNSLWDYLPDCDESVDGKIRPFYHSPEDSAAKGLCNREHVWPDSRGVGKSGPGSDPHIIRPALASDNSARGNKYFGLTTREFDPAYYGYDGARGEAARIIFYAATRYAKSHGLSLDNNPGASTDQKTMGSLKTLLEWNRQYPVNSAEIKRNQVLYGLGFARNPFIDFPEFAEYIWDENGLRGTSGIENQTGDLHHMVTTVSEIASGKPFFIAALNGSTCIAMTKNFSPNTPWYIKGAQISTPEDGQLRTDVDGITYWTLKAEGTGYRLSSDYGDLYGYNDGTYNSICYGVPASTTATSSSNVWNVSFASDGKLTLEANTATPVYLEFYNSSFCGFKREGSIPLYAYAK